MHHSACAITSGVTVEVLALGEELVSCPGPKHHYAFKLGVAALLRAVWGVLKIQKSLAQLRSKLWQQFCSDAHVLHCEERHLGGLSLFRCQQLAESRQVFLCQVAQGCWVGRGCPERPFH